MFSAVVLTLICLCWHCLQLLLVGVGVTKRRQWASTVFLKFPCKQSKVTFY